ncbi:unnamed protein product [Sphenostylis stenocarpa]|uniref:Uncharacterized protein n=1 Tax=Sphenostylis stenocarpa TaxID=92480 RepID=A0AA86STJ4_9FABA|nr:unnamed protein product [Sphenostylis stenocarpa]
MPKLLDAPNIAKDPNKKTKLYYYDLMLAKGHRYPRNLTCKSLKIKRKMIKNFKILRDKFGVPKRTQRKRIFEKLVSTRFK